VEKITRLAILLYAFEYKEDSPCWNIDDVLLILRRFPLLKELILTDEPLRYSYPWEETREPVFQEWQPSDNARKDSVKAIGHHSYLDFTDIASKLKMKMAATKGWKMPEIRYMAVRRQ